MSDPEEDNGRDLAYENNSYRDERTSSMSRSSEEYSNVNDMRGRADDDHNENSGDGDHNSQQPQQQHHSQQQQQDDDYSGDEDVDMYDDDEEAAITKRADAALEAQRLGTLPPLSLSFLLFSKINFKAGVDKQPALATLPAEVS
jgi:hypothetical protein